MAKKAVVEIEKPKPDALAVPRQEEDWEKKLGERARDVRSTLRTGVARINHKNQIITIDGARVKDNRVAVVVTGVAWVKTWYEKEYEEGSHDTPGCYAFGHKEDGLIHHPKSPLPQLAEGVSCDECPHNAFYTALKGKGKGKRCSDRPTLLVLLATDLEKKGEEEVNKAITKAKEYQLQVPPTSIKLLSQYVGSLAEVTDHGDIGEAITEVTTQGRTGGGGYELVFTFLGKVPREAMPALMKKGESSFEKIAQPFPVIAEEKDRPKQAPQREVKGQKRR